MKTTSHPLLVSLFHGNLQVTCHFCLLTPFLLCFSSRFRGSCTWPTWNRWHGWSDHEAGPTGLPSSLNFLSWFRSFLCFSSSWQSVLTLNDPSAFAREIYVVLWYDERLWYCCCHCFLKILQQEYKTCQSYRNMDYIVNSVLSVFIMEIIMLDYFAWFYSTFFNVYAPACK